MPGQYAGLPKLLAETGLSGAELARRIDVHPSTVSSWVKGPKRPPGAVIAYLKLLSAVLHAAGGKAEKTNAKS